MNFDSHDMVRAMRLLLVAGHDRDVYDTIRDDIGHCPHCLDRLVDGLAWVALSCGGLGSDAHFAGPRGGWLIPLSPVLERGLPEPPRWLPPGGRGDVGANCAAGGRARGDEAAGWPDVGGTMRDRGHLFRRGGGALCAGPVVDQPENRLRATEPVVPVVETARRDSLRFARALAFTPDRFAPVWGLRDEELLDSSQTRAHLRKMP